VQLPYQRRVLGREGCFVKRKAACQPRGERQQMVSLRIGQRKLDAI
jgi:hypothetical protein